MIIAECMQMRTQITLFEQFLEQVRAESRRISEENINLKNEIESLKKQLEAEKKCKKS